MRGSARSDDADRRTITLNQGPRPRKSPAVFWRNSQQLHALARSVRGAGWLLGFVILVVGAVMAARANVEVALLLRLTLAGAVLALTSTAAWLITRYADRTAARQSTSS
jgi:4-hydroxybenzoate polyprenyltransferase